MEKEIQTQYRQAQKEITSKWNNYMDRAGKRLEGRQNALSSALASGDKDKIAEAKNALESAQKAVTLQSAKYKAMVEDTALRISESNQTAIDYINNRTPNIYANNYNQVNGIAEDAGVQFRIINEDVVKKRIREGDIKLPKSRLSIPKDVRWNTKKMNSSVLQGILQGESMNDIAKRLLPIVDNNVNSALRNARTLVTQAENSGRLDSYKALEEEGAVLKKVWMATSDDRTREAHAELDGQERDVDEPFEDIDGNELMFPADPDAEPETVYNCRCTMVTRIVSVNGKETDTDAVTEQATEEAPQEEQDTGIAAAQTEFIPAASLEEAEAFAKENFVIDSTWSGNGNVSFKGMSLDMANSINEELTKLFDQNDIPKLNNIGMMNFRQNMWKGSKDAPMAYRGIFNGELYFNPKILKNEKELQSYIQKGNEAFQICVDNIDKFKGKQRELVETYKKVGKQIVADVSDTPLQTMVDHEIGHHIQHQVILRNKEFSQVVNDGFEEYSMKISGYATTSKGEYIAESFASYRGNLAEIDPALRKVFEEIKR